MIVLRLAATGRHHWPRPFGLLVVGLSLVLLAMVFRSIVVPVTAALGYALSIGAAFGLTSLVFISGFLAGPLNVAALGSVISFMPIILMGVLFGLAMDYEVFLVSRMREEYVHHPDDAYDLLWRRQRWWSTRVLCANGRVEGQA